jgi:hypothetical protein
MLKDRGICGAVVVKDIVEVRSKDCHVLGGVGRLSPVRESHCHVCHLLVVRRFSFRKEADVLPCQAWVELHVMDLLADVCIPCCLGMRHCMGNVMVKNFEVGLHGSLDCRGEMAHMLDCVFEGVVLGV